MKLKNISKLLFIMASASIAGSCTNLDETVYDQVMNENYYNTRADVIRAVYRPMEHAFYSIVPMFEIQEEPADQLGTPRRDSWWLDGQKWQRYHYHTWQIDEPYILDEWNACYTGIGQSNSVLFDLNDLDPSDFGITTTEYATFKAQNRTMRAYFHLRLLDVFRNVVIFNSLKQDQTSLKQSSPQETFDFIETELLACIEDLPAKTGVAGNGTNQGQWTKAAAAALLVRLYLNAEVYTGTPKYTECATYAQKIIDGEYGTYKLANTWDEPFDWKNETSNEVLFAYPGSFGGSHWHYTNDGRTIYNRCVPANAHYYFRSTSQGGHNPKYALQPSLDIKGNPYTFKLGRPAAKFQKYPEDYRLKLYKNLGNSKREGMMLFGYLEYTSGNITEKVKSPTTSKVLYLRDQVGIFNDLGPGQYPTDQTTSTMADGDHNSGWHFVKYPMYSDNDEGKRAADFALIRLAEVYYSLAECKLRAGSISDAAQLLNQVRRRNYPGTFHKTYLYAPDGNATLNNDEMLDEWGREFFGEGRRRIDLVRWGVFNTGRWWDKEPDADDHTSIYPIPQNQLEQNPLLKQNPGYPDIERK